jgi:hypothetical protein
MQVTLSHHGRALLEAALASGVGRSPEEVVERALEALVTVQPRRGDRGRTAADAAAHIRESRRGVRLAGLSVRDLINEGRKR